MSIRVLHVIDHMGVGGGPISTKSIVENINSRDVKSFVCALRTSPTQTTIKCELINLKYSKYDPRTILAIIALCKKYHIDILHAQLSKSIITCLLANIFHKIPVIIHERGGIFQKGIFFSLYRFLLRLLHQRASTIIANSQATALELTSKVAAPRHNIEVIYNPIDFNAFSPEKKSREQRRKNLKISDKDFVLGFVGRLHEEKGVDILIKAFSLLLRRSSKYLLVIAGEGPQRKSLEVLASQLEIADQLKFLGVRDDIPEVMVAFDIGVVPSRQESFGRVAVELMRMKVPVICSGVDGLAELVIDRITGFVTKENTPQNIAEAIECLAVDKKLQKQLIDNAYEFSQKFNIEGHIKKIMKVYKNCYEWTKKNVKD